MNVPNLFPTTQSDKRIALIGEAPGADEIAFGKPFMGKSGGFLKALLSRAGVQADACFFGNICQQRPHDNDISKFSWNGDEIQDGLYQLKKDIETFKPNIVVLLGNIPLKAAKDPTTVHNLSPKSYQFKNTKWRGSLFLGERNSPFEGLKCISTYHPAYCLRDYDVTPFLQFDLRKAVKESTSALLSLPQRKIDINLSEAETVLKLREIRQNKTRISPDIEGYVDAMSCIGIATSPSYAFVTPIHKFTPILWYEYALTLSDPLVPKILMNGFYDSFILSFSYGIEIYGFEDDIQMSHWELYSELAKDDKTMSDSESTTHNKKTRGKGGMSLAVQASMYTNEPYWKAERSSDDAQVKLTYCGKDCCVQWECWEYHMNALQGKNGWDKVRTVTELALMREHKQFNGSLIPIIRYMIRRGIRYNVEGASSRRKLLNEKLHSAQAELNALTGYGFSWSKGLTELQQRAQVIMMTKKGDRCRKEYQEAWLRFGELISCKQPGLAAIGELEDLCEVSLNVGSNKQFLPYLYETLKLPEQMSNVRGEVPHPTADYEALLKLSRWCQQNKHDLGFKVVQKAIEIRSLQTRQQMLSIGADRDERIRCGYNIVGSNTGRITCYESPTGSGYNLQTIPNYTEIKDAPGGVLGDRDLFLADEGFWLFQCDLSGADGWTVAAYSAMLGDSAMLEDYKGGIKPYARIALKIEGRPEADWTDRIELKAYLKTYKLTEGAKLTAKRVQHGGAYLEGGLTISRNILKDSEGKLYTTPTQCDALKNWYLKDKYRGITLWHNWIASRLKQKPVLTAASGQVRQFFGRPDEILTKAVAFEPQANTTYATNLAAWKLWSSTENRHSHSGGTSLKIEPLHQVHDALLGQFKKCDTSWATGQIKSYFANPLTIAGQQITIPYEGAYGVSWGELKEGKL
jgi:uracil-DNA glycosylase family 4